MKKLFIASVLVLLLAGCANNSANDPLPTESNSASSEVLEVSSLDKLEVSSYSLPLDKTYDHIDAVKLTVKDGADEVTIKIANKVNSWIAAQIADFQANAKVAYKSDRKNAKVLEFNMTYDESARSNRIFALTFTDYRYEGGAHGSSTVTTFAFDLSDGSQFDLVSQLDPAKRAQFNELAATALGEQAGTFDVDLDSKEMIISNLNNNENFTAWFASKSDGLAIIFQQYAVGPYSSGQPTIALSWKDLKPLLKTDSILLSEFAS
jgi:hypothetical protein